MKNHLFSICCVLLASFVFSCKKQTDVSKPETVTKRLKEVRNLLGDKEITNYQYDTKNRLVKITTSDSLKKSILNTTDIEYDTDSTRKYKTSSMVDAYSYTYFVKMNKDGNITRSWAESNSVMQSAISYQYDRLGFTSNVGIYRYPSSNYTFTLKNDGKNQISNIGYARNTRNGMDDTTYYEYYLDKPNKLNVNDSQFDKNTNLLKSAKSSGIYVELGYRTYSKAKVEYQYVLDNDGYVSEKKVYSDNETIFNGEKRTSVGISEHKKYFYEVIPSKK